MGLRLLDARRSGACHEKSVIRCFSAAHSSKLGRGSAEMSTNYYLKYRSTKDHERALTSLQKVSRRRRRADHGRGQK